MGWVTDQPNGELEPADGPMLVGDYALAYVRGLSGVDARTRHDYERDLTRTCSPSSGIWISATARR